MKLSNGAFGKKCCIDPWSSNCSECRGSSKQADLSKGGSDIKQCESISEFHSSEGWNEIRESG